MQSLGLYAQAAAPTTDPGWAEENGRMDGWIELLKIFF